MNFSGTQQHEAEFKVEQHLDATEQLRSDASLVNPSIPNSKFANIWKSVSPILHFLVHFPLLPAKWRSAISVLIDEADILTGQVPS